MKLRFFAQNGTFTKLIEKDLDKVQYDQLIKSRSILKSIYKHEELYDQVISTYLELKTAMYELSIGSALGRSLSDRIKTYDNMSKLNRLLFNTLNFGKMYLDEHYYTEKSETSSYVFNITGSDEDNLTLKDQREEIYKRNLFYVLGCDLRNKVQHASLPVNRFTAGVRTENTESIATFYTMISKEEFSKTKTSILNKFGKDIDLHEIIDGYISAISEMHFLSRSMIEESMENALALFKTTSEHLIKNDNAINIITVIGEKEEELFQLGMSWFDVVEHLQIKNPHTIHLGRTLKHHPYKEID